ncbi:MAG: signal peptide peptidase SppA [Prevotella sp.]|nr:signal peptide peptidase SppA [Prevotella sp.]
MKSFFKYVLATVVGLFVFGIIMGLFAVMSLVGMVSSSQATRNVSKNSVLVMNLSGTFSEQEQPDLLGKLTGQTLSTAGLNTTLSAIRKAKENDDIKGIYIEAGALSASFATLQEIRNALKDFRKSGKWIVCYGDTYSEGAYYLASVADKIYLNPQGMLDWHGLAAQPVFLKDLLSKVGVKYQVVKVGTFKSATETYTETKMSDANREQIEAFINGTWTNICKDVAESRKISTDSLNAYADRMTTFEPAENLKKYKLVDELIYADQVKDKVKKLLELKEDDKINQISMADMQNVKEKKRDGEQIAVYYAYGTIVQNNTTGAFTQDHNIVAKDVCADLEKLAKDDDVKAVVVRVNSPGGDAYASEQIWHQIVELKAKKPVVISMGDYAASGGYYISCAASWIVAQPNTLTGSIGIFGAFPDASELVTQKLGVKFDEVKTNKNSGFGNLMARPFNGEELSLLQGYINRGYDLFRKRVADGRKQKVEDIEKIAQGRVWLGQDALGIKLVDQLGGLDDAIAKAAKLAKLEEYYTREYPAAPDFIEQLMAASSKGNYLDEQMRLMLGDFYEPFSMLKTLNQREAIQARIPFVLNLR